MKVSKDIELRIGRDLEGKLARHVFINYIPGGEYSIHVEYYTIKNCVVYLIEKGNLCITGDTCFDVSYQCEILGDFKIEDLPKYERKLSFVSGERILSIGGLK
jgi:hypothetical protein